MSLGFCPNNVKGINIGKHSGITPNKLCDHKEHMRDCECDTPGHVCDHIGRPGGGGRAGILYMYITPKDFLIKIPQPTAKSQTSIALSRCPYALRRLNDRFD